MTLSQLMKNSYRNDDILIPSLASFSVYSIYPCWELCFSWLANANSGVATRPLWSSRWRSSSFSSISFFFWGGKEENREYENKNIRNKKTLSELCVCPHSKNKKCLWYKMEDDESSLNHSTRVITSRQYVTRDKWSDASKNLCHIITYDDRMTKK